MKIDLEPLRIVVETVPHEVVDRLDKSDAKLRAELTALRGMFSQAMDVIGELKSQIIEIQRKL